MGFKNDIKLQQYISPIFFETGTFLGGGVRTALRNGFSKVITIELQQYLYDQCVNGDPTDRGEDLVKEIAEGKVDIHLGDTRTIMWDLIKDIDDRITFWLDAHVDGGNYRQGQTPNVKPCPLYDEIQIIKNHKRKDHIILIDDLRIMGNDYSSGYGWGYDTNINSIKKMISEINPDYKFRYEDGEIPNDILVAYIEENN
jgi:hypothetical protein